MDIANGTCVSFCNQPKGPFRPSASTRVNASNQTNVKDRKHSHRSTRERAVGKCYVDRKRIQCWSNASQHISLPIYLQPFLKYSDISVASDWFSTVSWSEWAFFYHILFSPGYAPGTIAVNVTRLERGFNACKTPRCIYPSIFNRFWDIASY